MYLCMYVENEEFHAKLFGKRGCHFSTPVSLAKCSMGALE